MHESIPNTEPVLVAGNGNAACSVALCLVKAGHFVNLCTAEPGQALTTLLTNLADMPSDLNRTHEYTSRLKVSENLKNVGTYRLAIALTPEDLQTKKETIAQLENKLSPDSIIGINAEGIGLDVLQQDTRHAARICGINWTEPAQTTRFLEIISNDVVKKEIPELLVQLSAYWDKDPYVVSNFGIRSRLMSAMIREAFYLVQNGYASVEDIDRACRNDAGYYLPFAGNCRYMDLMGTYAYGIVMKDLNPDLCRDRQIPAFFKEIIKNGGLGMETGKGMYDYEEGEVELWKKVVNKFSYEIREIISKYPFNYKREDKAR